MSFFNRTKEAIPGIFLRSAHRTTFLFNDAGFAEIFIVCCPHESHSQETLEPRVCFINESSVSEIRHKYKASSPP